jgi:cell division protein FtsL
MSNLAKKLQQEQQQRAIQETKQNIPLKKALFSPGEKILGTLFAMMVFLGAVQIISNQAEIYTLNRDIQLTQASILEQQKVNSDLEVQVSELSTYERIMEKVTVLGLKLNENNVKVVQE